MNIDELVLFSWVYMAWKVVWGIFMTRTRVETPDGGDIPISIKSQVAFYLMEFLLGVFLILSVWLYTTAPPHIVYFVGILLLVPYLYEMTTAVLMWSLFARMIVVTSGLLLSLLLTGRLKVQPANLTTFGMLWIKAVIFLWYTALVFRLLGLA